MFQSSGILGKGFGSHYSWLLVFAFVCLSIPSFSQDRKCSIDVKAEVIAAKAGKATGQITLIIDQDDTSRYKVFLLNKGSENAREEHKDRALKGLRAGQYEFIIIDVKGDKCYKELTVKVQDAN